MVDVLTGHGDTIVIQQAKCVKIWGREGRLGHVEVFLQMCCFVTSIFERPRFFLCLQHARIRKLIYTQNSEEPMNVSTHQTTMFSDGRWMETRNKFVMLALFDTFDYYAVHFTEPLAVTAYNGWRAEHRELANGVEVRFHPPEPITRGELAVLEYKTSAPPNDPGRCS